ncbi:MAG: beta-N-acetylhexosaminidase [Alphaproteobacteria bacterium]|nr:beta-N-acetylhexosaminidase [Alphaproteobacteria bacterium]
MSFAASIPANVAPIIYGCTGTTLDADEKSFFKSASPAGFILFKKNCDSPAQVTALVTELRNTVGWKAPVLIDQEGGRVQRLRPPHWPDFPAFRTFGEVYKQDPDKALKQLKANIDALACVQCGMGVDVNCVPVLDIVPDDNNAMAINDRAFGSSPTLVAALGLAACEYAVATGMTPVMKHMPGHGRAVVDSHYELPHVDADKATLEGTDFLPFKTVASGMDNDTVWGMTAHVVYPTLDTELPATLSPTIIGTVIRGTIGFNGLLLTDDLFMEALGKWGDVPTRAALAIKAGCDIALHCHGTVPERAKAAETVGVMPTQTRQRLQNWAAKSVDTLRASVA